MTSILLNYEDHQEHLASILAFFDQFSDELFEAEEDITSRWSPISFEVCDLPQSSSIIEPLDFEDSIRLSEENYRFYNKYGGSLDEFVICQILTQQDLDGRITPAFSICGCTQQSDWSVNFYAFVMHSPLSEQFWNIKNFVWADHYPSHDHDWTPGWHYFEVEPCTKCMGFSVTLYEFHLEGWLRPLRTRTFRKFPELVAEISQVLRPPLTYSLFSDQGLQDCGWDWHQGPIQIITFDLPVHSWDPRPVADLISAFTLYTNIHPEFTRVPIAFRKSTPGAYFTIREKEPQMVILSRGYNEHFREPFIPRIAIGDIEPISLNQLDFLPVA